jgi:excisionase family DNA binding protein
VSVSDLSNLEPSDQPDPTMEQVEEIDGIPRRTQYKLIRSGEIESYLFAGRRRIIRASIKRYRERQIAKGPQLQPFITGKRKIGRPRKPRPQEHPQAAE